MYGKRTKGYTNLSGGLLQGIQYVVQGKKYGSVNRVILLSDGHANEGITDRGKRKVHLLFFFRLQEKNTYSSKCASYEKYCSEFSVLWEDSMDSIKIKIVNCYGINRLESEFDFTDNKSTHVIYAPNGVIKTSFASVFNDYSIDNESKDLIYLNRVSTRKITDIDGNEIKRESIFVVRPLEGSFKSEKVSTLLVKEELRKKYAEIHEKIDIEKEKLIKELKKTSGLKNNIEEEISESFTGDSKSILHILEELGELILDENPTQYNHITYKMVFDEKVIAFLETGDFKNQIKKYIEKYNELISNSTFLKKEFNHYNASIVHKNLLENGFFKAQENHQKKIIDLIFEVADELMNSEIEVGLNLENKVVLSIAIRLNAEIYMIKKINDDEFVSRINKFQTAKLFGKFKKIYFDDELSIEIGRKLT